MLTKFKHEVHVNIPPISIDKAHLLAARRRFADRVEGCRYTGNLTAESVWAIALQTGEDYHVDPSALIADLI